MKLEQRSYSTKFLRPRPVIHAEPDGSLLVITISWGSPDLASRINEDIVKYLQAAVADVEVTSPFEFMTCYGDEANYLRVASLISNETIYRAINRTEYTGGVEILLLSRKGNKISFAQVGAPYLLLEKVDVGTAPIAVASEVGFECIADRQAGISPLPRELLGVDPTVNIRCGDFRVDPDDRLILYSGSYWPEGFWESSNEGARLQSLTHKLVKKNPESPFWLGIIDFKSEN